MPQARGIPDRDSLPISLLGCLLPFPMVPPVICIQTILQVLQRKRSWMCTGFNRGHAKVHCIIPGFVFTLDACGAGAFTRQWVTVHQTNSNHNFPCRPISSDSLWSISKDSYMDTPDIDISSLIVNRVASL